MLKAFIFLTNLLNMNYNMELIHCKWISYSVFFLCSSIEYKPRIEMKQEKKSNGYRFLFVFIKINKITHRRFKKAHYGTEKIVNISIWEF